MSFIKELWLYLNARKKFWLFPVILVILMLGVLIILEQSSVIVPFIYAIF